mgnify:CR=1 FL=1
MIILNKSIKKELIQNQKATPGVVSIICPPSDSGTSSTVKNVNPNNTDNKENTILSVFFGTGSNKLRKKRHLPARKRKPPSGPATPSTPSIRH